MKQKGDPESSTAVSYGKSVIKKKIGRKFISLPPAPLPPPPPPSLAPYFGHDVRRLMFRSATHTTTVPHRIYFTHSTSHPLTHTHTPA